MSVEMVDNSVLVKATMEQKVEIVLELIGMQAEKYAKMNCPVDTGRLRNSITHQRSMIERAENVGSPVNYASYVEFGTQKTRSQPFLRHAVQDHADEYKGIAEAILKGTNL